MEKNVNKIDSERWISYIEELYKAHDTLLIEENDEHTEEVQID